MSKIGIYAIGLYAIGLLFSFIGLVIFSILLNNQSQNLNRVGIAMKTGDIVSLGTALLPATSTTYNTKIWSTIIPSSPLDVAYPEKCSQNMYGNPVPNVNKVSICISGGGSRSCMSSVGYFRALNRMGYKNKAQYVASVSGGSWFYGVYTFYEGKYGNVTDILGVSSGLNISRVPDPSKLTLENLINDNSKNTKYYGYLIKKENSLELLIQNLFTTTPIDKIFPVAIGKIILEPLGLNAEVPIALNKTHATEIKSRNILSGTPMYPAVNTPFWICVTNLMFDFLGQYPFVILPMTPLYSGIPQKITQNDNTIGGVVSETFSFGNSSSPNSTIPIAKNDCLNSYMTNLNRIPNITIRTLRDIITVSSASYAISFYKPDFKTSISTFTSLLPKDIKDLIPKFYIWGSLSPLLTTSDSQCTSNLITGGCSASSGYEPKSCTKLGFKCYSNTTNQCVNSSQCSYSWKNAECMNTNSNNSSLNCKGSPFGCTCVIPGIQPYKQNISSLNLQEAKIGDGGYSDQLGIVSLVARGVTKIISLANLKRDIGSTNSDYCELQQLFGIMSQTCIDSGLVGANTSQVFKTEDYTKLETAINKSIASGGPTFARLTLDVLPNTLYGVKGGYQVDILFLFIWPLSKRFYDSLNTQIKSNITESTINPGLFNNFPQYNTLLQNPLKGVLMLTNEQSNLLSTYTDWCISQPEVKVHVDQMFKY